MRRSSDNGEEESSNDDNGSAPHELPLNQIEEGQPSQQPSQLPPTYKPRRTANKRNATGLSFSLKLKPSSSDSSDTASNIPRRASDPSDVESQRNLSSSPPNSSQQPAAAPNNFSIGPVSSPTIRRSIFKVGRRESDNISEASSDAAPDNNNQSHARKRSTFRLPPLFSPPTVSTNNSEDEYYNNDNERGMSDYDPHPNPHSTNNENNNNGRQSTMRHRLTAIRRFNINDYVLLAPYLHDINRRDNETGRYDASQLSYNNLVNRYGFPEWSSSATTAEERRGPYIYLIAQVVSVHYGEDAQYYTVKRMDNDETQRADVQYMEPITSSVGIETAIYAARKSLQTDENNYYGGIHDAHTSTTRSSTSRWCKPCLTTLTRSTQYILQQIRIIHEKLKKQLDACLNGNRPYGISCRFTGVNFLVLCSLWYLYIDQLRLAFMPHSADYACAVISL